MYKRCGTIDQLISECSGLVLDDFKYRHDRVWKINALTKYDDIITILMKKNGRKYKLPSVLGENDNVTVPW